MPRMKHLVAWAATFAVMLAIDALWLGVIAKGLYQQGMGSLMGNSSSPPGEALDEVWLAIQTRRGQAVLRRGLERGCSLLDQKRRDVAFAAPVVVQGQL